MEPYCVLKLGSAGFQTKKSSSTNPRWGEKATFKVEHGVTSLFVEIFNRVCVISFISREAVSVLILVP